MSDRPIFSIIIPCYHAEAYLQKAVSSIQSQSFKDWEVIIQDGGSKDGTLSLAKTLASSDARIVVYSEKDQGVYDAMNKGRHKSRGEWLYFMGADDYLWDGTILQHVYDFIVQNDADLVYGNVFSPDYGEHYDGPFDIMKLLSKNICHQAMFARRTLFDITGDFNIAYRVHADYDFTLKCFFNDNIRKAYMPLRIAYFAPGGLSIRERHDAFKLNMKKILICYGWYVLPESVLKRYYSSRLQYLVDRIKRMLRLPPPPLPV
jgi:glycosyltransferase involved in cell wall biosynthesis